MNAKCKACGQKTGKETTKITLVFSISNPEEVEINVENKYKKLCAATVINNRKALHNLLDKTLDKISNECIQRNIDARDKK